MKTLKEIKDEVAVRVGFQNWKHMDQNSSITEMAINAVARMYANDKLDQAYNNHRDTYSSLSDYENALTDILQLKDDV